MKEVTQRHTSMYIVPAVYSSPILRPQFHRFTTTFSCIPRRKRRACKKELDSIPCVTPQRIRQRILEPHVLILRNFVGCSYETLYTCRAS